MHVRYSIVVEKVKITDYLLVWKEKNDKSISVSYTHLDVYKRQGTFAS